MTLDESFSETDDVLEKINNLPFIFRKSLAPYMDGLVIDYIHSWFGWRLVLESEYGGNC